MKSAYLLVLSLAFSCTQSVAPADANGLPISQVKLPAGFKIEVYASGIENARSMARGPQGTLFVGTMSAGKVYALVDTNNDNKIDKVYTIATGLNGPNGIAFKDGALYVGEIGRISKYADIESNLAKPPVPKIIYDKLPTEEHHGWRYMAFGPDGLLYIGVGAPCNVCERPDDERFATIVRMKDDGSSLELYARGVRNTVGFDWDPSTKELWFTDNGRDLLGDDVPPDELNHATAANQHFGFPFCHGGDVIDPDLGGTRKCSEFTPPAMKLGAHVASLGMRFYTGNMFPAQYKNQVFIAEHGSWNRSKKSGYRLSLVRVKDNKAQSYEPFAEGFKQGETSWGRPVDILQLPDGSLLVSDDLANAIYRISYAK